MCRNNNSLILIKRQKKRDKIEHTPKNRKLVWKKWEIFCNNFSIFLHQKHSHNFEIPSALIHSNFTVAIFIKNSSNGGELYFKIGLYFCNLVFSWNFFFGFLSNYLVLTSLASDSPTYSPTLVEVWRWIFVRNAVKCCEKYNFHRVFLTSFCGECGESRLIIYFHCVLCILTKKKRSHTGSTSDLLHASICLVHYPNCHCQLRNFLWIYITLSKLWKSYAVTFW